MRAFIGIRIIPFEGIKEVLKELRKKGGIKTVEEENLHINIKFLGEISEKQAEEVKEVLKKLKAKPFNALINGIGFFPSENFIRVIFIKVISEELMKINEFIEEKLYEKGFMKEKREYAPHITLARVKRPLSKKEAGYLKEKEIKKEIRIREIELIKSTLTKQKPVYETIFKVSLS